jgi:phosphatidylglycerophosphatase A
MPGTYGSALGVLLYLGLAALARATAHPALALGAAAVVVTALSIGVAALALRSFYEPDPQVIVLDEVAGQVLALLPLPLTAPLAPSSYWIAVGIGFLLFRALDTLKPYPIWKVERLHGVWGVMGDDLAAGLLAAVILGMLLRVTFGL